MKNKNEPTLFRRLPHPAGLLSVLLCQPAFGALRRLSRSAAALLLLATLSASLQAGIVFNNGFENGSSEWGTSGAWSPEPANASVSSIAREGTKSVKFLPVSNDKRSELVVSGDGGQFDWGTEYWVGFSLQVVVPTGGFRIINQHHAKPHSVNGTPDWSVGAGGNSFTIMIDGNDFDIRTQTNPAEVFQLPAGGATQGTQSSKIPFVTGRWYDFVLNFRLATDNTGIMRVWIRDTVTGTLTQLVNVTAGPTVYLYDRDMQPKTPVNYQKIGMYYGDGNASAGGELLYDAFRIWEGPGGSFEAVAPDSTTMVPVAPSGLTATAVSNSTINLSWTDNASNETGFEVDRALNNTFTSGLVSNAYVTGANPSMPVPAGGLAASTPYYFRVRATNANGDSAVSSFASATTLAGGGIGFRSASSANSGSGSVTSLAVSKPAGVVNGDYMLIGVAVGLDTATITAPAGWTLVREITDGMRMWIYRKTAGSSEPSSYTWSVSASTKMAAGIVAFTGVSAVQVENGAGQTSGSSTSHTTPTISTTGSTTWLVSIFGDKNATGSTWTAPAGATERVDTRATGNSAPSVSINTQGPVSAGSKSHTATASVSSGTVTTEIIALQP